MQSAHVLHPLLWVAIALGGGLGACFRYFTHYMLHHIIFIGIKFPIGIMFINVMGAVLMGMWVGWFARHQPLLSLLPTPPLWLNAFIGIGFLGGFTTFSSFALDAYQLWSRGDYFLTLVYLVLSVILGFLGLVLGIWLMKT